MNTAAKTRTAIVPGTRLAIARVLILLALSAGATPVLADGGPDMRVLRDARRRTLTLEVGPIRIAGSAGYEEIHTPVFTGGVFGVDGWIRSLEAVVVDGRGRPLDGPRIHHAALLAPGERNVFTPTLRRIVSFGAETSRIDLPGQLGYRIHPGDSVIIAAAFFNPTPAAYDSVYLHVRATYADVRLDARLQDILPIYMDVMPTGSVAFDVPPGGIRMSREWRPAVSGRLMGLGGHMHENGVELILEDATTGETLWSGRAEYDESGEVTGVARKFFLRGLSVSRDHVYRVTAVYRNPTDQVIGGAMGQIGGLLLPDAGEQMPRPDPSDPAYQLDLSTQYGGYGQTAHHRHHH